MNANSTQAEKKRRLLPAVVVVIAIAAIAAYATSQYWIEPLQQMIAGLNLGEANKEDDHGHDDHSGHDHSSHDHPGHKDEDALELSPEAQKNVGLRLIQIKLKPFEKTISVPAMVVERPGQSQIAITAPMTGVVTQIYSLQGEAVSPGQKLFDLRLTHEDLVAAQREFLSTAEELDVVKSEIKRIKSASEGIFAGKTLLAREYEQQKLEGSLRAHHQGLLLHSLSKDQIDEILESRNLLQMLTITAPEDSKQDSPRSGEVSFHVQKLNVKKGQSITAGDSLCSLAEHSSLFIEGRAFEQDGEWLNKIANEDRELSALIRFEGEKPRIIKGLKILYLSDEVETDSRALHFYVVLPNEKVRDVKTEDGRRFIGWRYKPGQRIELLAPVQRWEDRIVLPVEAIVQEGAEAYVFKKFGDHFDRIPVHVEYRDQLWVVIEQHKLLQPGVSVAASGAFQMHLAIKNRSGGGVDPHAGHSH